MNLLEYPWFIDDHQFSKEWKEIGEVDVQPFIKHFSPVIVLAFNKCKNDEILNHRSIFHRFLLFF